MKFKVENAKSGQASCKYPKCKAKIEKESVRLGKVSPSPFSEGAEMVNWFHIECAFEQMSASTRTIRPESLEDLEGIEDLGEEDQEKIQKLFEGLSNGKLNVSM